MPKRIYLDTKDWIELLKVEKGKRDGQSPRELPYRLRKLAGAGKVRVLFSALTVNEIHEYHKKEEQDDLIDLMIDISGLHVLKPYSVEGGRLSCQAAFARRWADGQTVQRFDPCAGDKRSRGSNGAKYYIDQIL